MRVLGRGVTKERFDLDSEAPGGPWFPLPPVLDGLFALCGLSCSGIPIVPADGEATESGIPDVRFFFA